MLPIIVVDNESVTLQYLPDKRMIYHTIHKPILEDDVLKACLEAGTEALKKHGACKWLSDDRKNGPLSSTFLQWATKDWQPRTIAAGWKYWANVVPHEIAAAGTLMPVIDNLHEMGLRMLLFSDLEKAFEWLERLEG